jgi:hypothetical protein
MIPPKNESPPGRAGLETKHLHGDGRNTAKNPAPVQGAIAALQREFVAECLRIVALKAIHAADNTLIADDANAERDIGIAVSHIREAAKSFREFQVMTGAAQ